MSLKDKISIGAFKRDLAPVSPRDHFECTIGIGFDSNGTEGIFCTVVFIGVE